MSLDNILRSVGKNLFDKSTLTAGSSVVEFTQTANGFTFKTAATQKTMLVGSNIYLIAGTYYCSGTVTCSDTSYKGGWAVYDNETGKFIINASSRGTINDKFTITESKTYQLNFYAPYNAPVGVIMTFENVQLEKGSTATTYEPYQQDPKSIKIPYKGSNIITYPYENTTQYINGVTFTVGKDGSITINGTPTDTTKFDVKDSITLEQNKQYTLSGFKERPEGSAGAVLHLDTIDGMLQNITIDSQYQTQTFTADSSNYYCYIIVPTTGDLVDNIVFYPQLEEGTVATEFSLNTGDKEVLKVSYGSRNLFDETKITTTSTIGLAISTNSDGTHKLAGTLTADFSYFNNVNLSLPQGTTITATGWYDSTPTGNFIGLVGYAEDKTVLFQLNSKASGIPLTNTLTANLASVGLVVRCPASAVGDSVSFDNIRLQLEIGDKVTEYVPYSREVIWTK